jgi:hypothetical protein
MFLGTSVVPGVCPLMGRGSRDSDAVAGFLTHVACVEILHVAESPDETGLVRLLGFLDRLIKLTPPPNRCFTNRPRRLFFITL